MGEEHRTGELDRIVAALAAGDPAFAVTLVARYGPAVTRAARDRGVPEEDLDAVVHETALALVDRPIPAGVGAWGAVLAALEARASVQPTP